MSMEQLTAEQQARYNTIFDKIGMMSYQWILDNFIMLDELIECETYIGGINTEGGI